MSHQWVVKEEFKTLCCNFPRKVGEVVISRQEISKNRMMIEGEVGMHKVKKSTFYRCCKQL